MNATGSSVSLAIAGKADITGARLGAALADWAGAVELEQRLADTAAAALRELDATRFIGVGGASTHERQVLADAATVVRRASYPAAKRLVEAADRAAAAGHAVAGADADRVAAARAVAAEANKRQRQLPTPPRARPRQKLVWLVAGALVGAGLWSAGVSSYVVQQMGRCQNDAAEARRALTMQLELEALRWEGVRIAP